MCSTVSGCLLVVLLFLAPVAAQGQYTAPQARGMRTVAPPTLSLSNSEPRADIAVGLHQVHDDFTIVGLIGGMALGATIGGITGFMLDRYFNWSGAEDRGIGGLYIGIVVGGTAGAIWGGHRSNWEKSTPAPFQRNAAGFIAVGRKESGRGELYRGAPF